MSEAQNVNESTHIEEEKEVNKKAQPKIEQGQEETSAQKLIDKLKSDLKKIKQGKEKRRIIMLCVDSSKYSTHAVQWSIENTLQKDDVVILFTVWEEAIDLTVFAQADPLAPLMIDPTEIAKNNEAHLKQASQLLHSIYNEHLKKFQVVNLLISCTNSNTPSIGSLIVDSANQFEVDYIIVGSRGLGAFKQFFMGSVSKYVVEHAHCPVLVVKDNQ